MATELAVAPHPLLHAIAFETRLPARLEALPPSSLHATFLTPGAEAPVTCDDALRTAVRALLRHGGFKPSGRSKPASEYLVRAVEQQALPSINLVVDACNAVSFHSGLPISVVDLAKATPPLQLRVVEPGQSYVFNLAGQELDLGGLLCLCDALGPCANAVKDAQRTKTDASTTQTLSVLWCPASHRSEGEAAARWYRELLEAEGATTADVRVVPSP